MGLSKNGAAPNPMVHCIYESPSQAAAGAVKAVEKYGAIMVCAPTEVKLQDEMKRCSWCGSVSHRHRECDKFRSLASMSEGPSGAGLVQDGPKLWTKLVNRSQVENRVGYPSPKERRNRDLLTCNKRDRIS